MEILLKDLLRVNPLGLQRCHRNPKALHFTISDIPHMAPRQMILFNCICAQRFRRTD